MQTIYGIIFVITTIILAVRGGLLPTESKPKSLHETLIEYSSSKCPYLKTTKLLDPKPVFLDVCSNYNTIKSITSFNFHTSSDILCLLYYNNYISLCNVSGMAPSFNNTVIDNLLKGFTPQTVCQYLQKSKLIADLEHMKNITSNMWGQCNFICTNGNKVSSICGLAAVSLNLTEWLKVMATLEARKNQQVKDTAPEKPAVVKSEQLPDKQPVAPIPDVQDKNMSKNEKLLPVHDSDDPAHNMPSNNIRQLPHESQEKPPQNNVDPPKVHTQVESADTPVNKVGDTGKKAEASAAADIIVKEKPSEVEVKSPTNDGETKPKSEGSNINPKPPLTGSQEDVPKVSTNAEDQTSKLATDVAKPNTPPAVQEPKPEEENIDIDSREEMEPQSNDPQNIEEDSMEEDEPSLQEPPKVAEKIKQNTKPKETDEDAMLPAYNNSNTDEEDSLFFIYFMMVCAVFILGYIGYHNKQKVLALVIEGRRGRRGSRRGRPNSANYHKLDSNLEEAVTSACNKNTTNIIY